MEKITLVISAQTLNTLGLALGELPYKIARPAIDEIQAQVLEYEARKNAAADEGKSVPDWNNQSGRFSSGNSDLANRNINGSKSPS